jgi:hypothetical protein
MMREFQNTREASMKKRAQQIWLFIVIAALPLSLSAQDAKIETTVIPFTFIETGHFMLKVKLNDKGPYNLIFDTGAPMSLINNRIAKESGVTKAGGGGGFMPFGAMNTAQAIQKLEVGSLTAKKISTMVMDHPTVAAFSQFYMKKHGERIDGIIGFPFFARYSTTVNYQTQELTLTPNGFDPPDVMADMMKTMMAKTGKQEPKTQSPQGYYGMSFTAKTDDAAGVTIDKVFENSPAAKAGLKPGDRLLTIDDRWTDSITDAYMAASYGKIGTAVPVSWLREGKRMTQPLTPVAGF